jgi:hypothetical protein
LHAKVHKIPTDPGPGWVVGSNSSYKPITNTAWVRAQLCKLQKGCTWLAAASDKVYQLLAQGQWFSPASSTTKTGRHDIAEILLKVALKHQKSNQINQQIPHLWTSYITTFQTLQSSLIFVDCFKQVQRYIYKKLIGSILKFWRMLHHQNQSSLFVYIYHKMFSVI